MRVFTPCFARIVYANKSVSVVRDAEGRPSFNIAVVNDISEKIRLEIELRHAQKLESVGRLAAGIAHEINTPVQFVGDSVRFVHDAVQSVVAVLGAHRAFGQRLSADPSFAAQVEELAAIEEEADIPYLLENEPSAASPSAAALGGIDDRPMALYIRSNVGDISFSACSTNGLIDRSGCRSGTLFSGDTSVSIVACFFSSPHALRRSQSRSPVDTPKATFSTSC